jgi:hypothetical protein
VQQRREAVPLRHPLQRFHHQHLVVAGDVALLEERGDLVLARRHLIVPGLDRHAQAVELELRLGHELEHPGGDGSEVVVFQLLALGRARPEEGALTGHQVRPLEIQLPVHEEILLLRTHRREHARDAGVGPEEFEDPERLLRERLHRAEEGDLRVQRLARP